MIAATGGHDGISLCARLVQKGAAMTEPQDFYRCTTVNCGYIYDPDRGDRRGKIPKGTSFADLPHDWVCPVCGVGKKVFVPMA